MSLDGCNSPRMAEPNTDKRRMLCFRQNADTTCGSGNGSAMSSVYSPAEASSAYTAVPPQGEAASGPEEAIEAAPQHACAAIIGRHRTSGSRPDQTIRDGSVIRRDHWLAPSRSSWPGTFRDIKVLWRSDSLRGRFARGATWSLAGATLAQGANLIVSIITARLLGAREFGQFGIIQSTVGMLAVFAGLGLGVTASKYVAVFRTGDPARAGSIVALTCGAAIISGLSLTLALLLLAPLLAERTLNSATLTQPLRISSVLLFMHALNGAQNGALAGFEAFRAIARTNAFRAIVALPLTLLLVAQWGLLGAIASLIVTTAITCVFTHLSLRQACRSFGITFRLRAGWRERSILWTYSTPAFLSTILVAPALWLSNTMLVNQSGGFTELGVLTAAGQWRTTISFVPAVLAQFALPLLSNLDGNRDLSRYRTALRWNLYVTAAAAITVALPVMGLSPWLMRLYGAGFEHGWLVLVLSSVTAVITCINSVIGTAILSSGSVWAGFAFNLMWASVLLMLSVWLIPAHLALGFALSMLCSYLAHSVWQAFYLMRILHH